MNHKNLNFINQTRSYFLAWLNKFQYDSLRTAKNRKFAFRKMTSKTKTFFRQSQFRRSSLRQSQFRHFSFFQSQFRRFSSRRSSKDGIRKEYKNHKRSKSRFFDDFDANFSWKSWNKNPITKTFQVSLRDRNGDLIHNQQRVVNNEKISQVQQLNNRQSNDTVFQTAAGDKMNNLSFVSRQDGRHQQKNFSQQNGRHQAGNRQSNRQMPSDSSMRFRGSQYFPQIQFHHFVSQHSIYQNPGFLSQHDWNQLRQSLRQNLYSSTRQNFYLSTHFFHNENGNQNENAYLQYQKQQTLVSQIQFQVQFQIQPQVQPKQVRDNTTHFDDVRFVFKKNKRLQIVNQNEDREIWIISNSSKFNSNYTTSNFFVFHSVHVISRRATSIYQRKLKRQFFKFAKLRSFDVMKFDFAENSIVFFIRKFQHITKIEKKSSCYEFCSCVWKIRFWNDIQIFRQ